MKSTIFLICVFCLVAVNSKPRSRGSRGSRNRSWERGSSVVDGIMRQIECELSKLKQIAYAQDGNQTYQAIIQEQPTLQRQLTEACKISELQKIGYVQMACRTMNIIPKTTPAPTRSRNPEKDALKGVKKGVQDIIKIDKFLKQNKSEDDIKTLVYNNDPVWEELLNRICDAVDTAKVAKPVIKACEFATGDSLDGTTIWEPDHPERGNVTYGDYENSNCVYGRVH